MSDKSARWRESLNAADRAGEPAGRVAGSGTAHPDLAPAQPTDCSRDVAHILRDQLHVGEDEFLGLRPGEEGATARRGEPTTPSIPAGVVAQLLLSHGVEESAVRQMSQPEAIERLNRIWSQDA